MGNRDVVAFCSNDYLGLARHPHLATAAAAATVRHGLGTGASRLVSGEVAPHRDLEEALATQVHLPSALLFSTGYQANLGLITALAGPDDLIVSDELNHASLIDGSRLSRAKIAIYRHRDPDSAATALASSRSFRRRFIVTESLFSMDGDRAPLRALADLSRQHDATLVVDEAHALGVLGPGGQGLCVDAGITPDVLVGTLGKALGSFGGFVAGAPALRSYLVNRSRSFIFTTAPPAALAAGALAALDIVRSDEGTARRARLASHLTQLHRGLSVVSGLAPPPPPPFGPIVPVLIGADARAVAVAAHLLEQGFFVPAIRPPTVPEGTARLRITLSANHTTAQIDGLVAALRGALR
jgi:8-amino-7-oxononanoate synthase